MSGSGANVAVSHSELTTVLTTTMTTVRLPDASTYMTIELVSCLFAPSACAYGSEGWEFESLRARSLPANIALSTTCDTPVADTFPLHSLSTFLTGEFFEYIAHVRAARLTLQIVRLGSRQLGVRQLLLLCPAPGHHGQQWRRFAGSCTE